MYEQPKSYQNIPELNAGDYFKIVYPNIPETNKLYFVCTHTETKEKMMVNTLTLEYQPLTNLNRINPSILIYKKST